MTGVDTSFVEDSGTVQGDDKLFAPNPNEFNYYKSLFGSTLTGFDSSRSSVSAIAARFAGRDVSGSSGLCFRFGLVWRFGLWRVGLLLRGLEERGEVRFGRRSK